MTGLATLKLITSNCFFKKKEKKNIEREREKRTAFTNPMPQIMAKYENYIRISEPEPELFFSAAVSYFTFQVKSGTMPSECASRLN